MITFNFVLEEITRFVFQQYLVRLTTIIGFHQLFLRKSIPHFLRPNQTKRSFCTLVNGHPLSASRFYRSILNASSWKPSTQDRKASNVISHCPVGWIVRRAFCGGEDKVYSCLETTMMERCWLLLDIWSYRTLPTVIAMIWTRNRRPGGTFLSNSIY